VEEHRSRYGEEEEEPDRGEAVRKDEGEENQRKDKEAERKTRRRKEPQVLPRFCHLCKIYGHSDLTCHLQGNAPTPGPSIYTKPFKYMTHGLL